MDYELYYDFEGWDFTFNVSWRKIDDTIIKIMKERWHFDDENGNRAFRMLKDLDYCLAYEAFEADVKEYFEDAARKEFDERLESYKKKNKRG